MITHVLFENAALAPTYRVIVTVAESEVTISLFFDALYQLTKVPAELARDRLRMAKILFGLEEAIDKMLLASERRPGILLAHNRRTDHDMIHRSIAGVCKAS